MTDYTYGPTDLTGYLAAAGLLNPGNPRQRAWLKALQEVPRHLFTPARAWAQPQNNKPDHVIDRDRDPGTWWKAVYTNTAITTQRDDGAADIADTSAYPTSSLSSPHVVAEMLNLLGVDRHHQVLEIGTGSGWTAGLLAWRLGDDQVTTIEVDEAVAASAEGSLKAAGVSPRVIVGDGALGAPDGRLWDRVHVTCGVRDIPYAWVEQTRPGGVIVIPWMPMPGQWGYQLRLDVLDDGSAVGSFHGDCGFMMLRSQRHPSWPPYPGDSVESTTNIDPREIWAALDQGFGLALAAAAPHIVITGGGWEESEDWSAWVMRLRDLRGPGWAVAAVPPGEDVQVTQHEERRLWTHLEGAFMEWLRAGRPGRDQYRMMVTAGGQDVWLP